MIATKATPRPAFTGLWAADSVSHMKINKKKNVRWTRSSTPKIRPAGMDQFLMETRILPLPLFYSLRLRSVPGGCDIGNRRYGVAWVAWEEDVPGRDWATPCNVSIMRVIAGKYRSRQLR